jgi:hypothetical protein
MPVFTIREAFSLGWERAKPNLGNLVLVLVVYVAVIVGFALLNILLDKPMHMLSLLLQLINIFIIGPIMGLGFVRAGLKAFDGQAPSPADLFNEAQHLTRYWMAVLTSILPLVLAAGVAGVAAVVAVALAKKGDSGMLAVALILGLLSAAVIVASIALAFRVTFYAYFILDRALGGWASVKASWQATRGQVWHLLGFTLVVALFNVLGACALLVGLFITLPITLVAWAYAYRKLESASAVRLAQGS